MSEFLCPKCKSPLLQVAKMSEPGASFWMCSSAGECTFMCSDENGEPYLKTCPECGEYLVKGTSKKTGRQYIACFNKARHASGKVIFFTSDGTPIVSDTPVAKGTFTCPECHETLLYRKIRKGRFVGRNIFLCPNLDGHRDGKVHFFKDLGGTPLFPKKRLKEAPKKDAECENEGADQAVGKKR